MSEPTYTLNGGESTSFDADETLPALYPFSDLSESEIVFTVPE